MTDGKPINREDYKYFNPITTRWMDNDVFGHVNNVTYYSYFDTTANQYLIEQADFDIHNAPIVGFVVHSNCNYLSPIAYPDKIEAGLYVKKIGNSAVTYGVGVFKKGENTASAFGEFVHVFVNRKEKKSVSIPEKMRIAMEKLLLH
jgi:acyl-CoA thioester hydrolase|tara:strand:- start:1850 stop:2287 length:438 start_codon:yes stop_codon:yes gene_type:complete